MLKRFGFSGKDSDQDAGAITATNSTGGIAQKLFDRIMPKMGDDASSLMKQSSASNSNASTPDIYHDADSSATASKDSFRLAVNAYTDPKPPLSDNPHYINRRFTSFKVLSAKEQQALAEQLYPTTLGAHQLQINKALYSYSLTQILQALLATWKTVLDPKKFLHDIVRQAAPADLLDINVFNEANDSDSEDEGEEDGESVKSSPGAKSTADRPQTTEDLFANISLNAISCAKDIPWLNLILCIGKDESRARVLLSVTIKTVLATKFFKDNAENKQQHIASEERLKIKLKQLMISPSERLRNGSTVEELILYGYSLEDIIDGLMECYNDEEAFGVVCLRSIKLKNDFSISSELEDKIKHFVSKAASNPSYKLQQAGINFNDFRAYVVEHPEHRHLLCEQIVVASIFSLPLIEDSVVNAAFEKINLACHQLLMKDDVENPSRESVRLSLMRPAESVLDVSAVESAVETLLLHGVEDKVIVNCYVTSMKYWTMKKQEIETKKQEAVVVKPSRELTASAITLVDNGGKSNISSFDGIISGIIERVKPIALAKLESGFHQAYYSLGDQVFALLERLNVEVNDENARALFDQAWPALDDGDNNLLTATKCLLKIFQHQAYDQTVAPLIDSDQSELLESEDGDKSELLTNSKKLGLLVAFIGSVLHFSKYGEEGEFPLRLASIGVNTIDDLNALFGLLKNQRHFSDNDIEEMHALFGRWLLDAKGVDLVDEIISSKQIISGTMIASQESSSYSKALHGRVTNAVDSRVYDEQLLCDSTLYADTAVSTARLHYEFSKLARRENFLAYRALINTLDDFICANQYDLAEPLVAKNSFLKADAYHQALEGAQDIIKQHIVIYSQSNARDSISAQPLKAVCIEVIKLLLFPYGNEGAFADVDFSTISMDTFKNSTGDLARRYSSLSARTQRILKVIVLTRNFKPIAARASMAAPFIQSDKPYYIEPEVQPVRNIFASVMDSENSIVFATDCITQLQIYISFFESSYVTYKQYNNATNFHALLDQMSRFDSNISAIKSMSLDLTESLEAHINKLESNLDIDSDEEVKHCKLISLFLRVVFIKQLSQLAADLHALRFEEISCRRVNIGAHQHSAVLEELCEASDFSKQLKVFEIYVSNVREQNNNGASLSDLAMLCIYMLIKPLMAEGKKTSLMAIAQSAEIMQLITTQTVFLILKYDADGLDILKLLLSSDILLTDVNAQLIDSGLSSSVNHYDLIHFHENKGTVKYVIAKIIILQLLYQHEEACLLTDPRAKQTIEQGEFYYLKGLVASFAESFSRPESSTFSNTYLYQLLASAPEIEDLFTAIEYFFAKADISLIKNQQEKFNSLFKLFDDQCCIRAPLYTNVSLSSSVGVLSILSSVFSTADTTDRAFASNILHEVLYRVSEQLFVSSNSLAPKDDFNHVFQETLNEVLTQANPAQTERFVAQAKLDTFNPNKEFIEARVKSIELFKSATYKIGHSLSKIFNSALNETLPHSITYKLVVLLDFFAMLDPELLEAPSGLVDESGENMLLIGCLAKAVEASRLENKVLKQQTGKKNYEVIVTSLYQNIITNTQPFLIDPEMLLNSKGQVATLNSREGLYLLLAKKFGNEKYTPIFMRLEMFAMRKHNRQALNGICGALCALRIGSSEFKMIEKYFKSIHETELNLEEAEENLCAATKEGDETKINLTGERVEFCKKAQGSQKRIFTRLCARFDLEYKKTDMKTALNNRRHSGLTAYFGTYSERKPMAVMTKSATATPTL
jgi:hypothetical protein